MMDNITSKCRNEAFGMLPEPLLPNTQFYKKWNYRYYQ